MHNLLLTAFLWCWSIVAWILVFCRMAGEGTAEIRRTGMADRDYLKAEYAVANSWAQHYSTVRMSIAALFVPASLGFLQYGYANRLPFYRQTAFGLWLTALVIFSVFTMLVERDRSYSKKIRKLLQTDAALQHDSPGRGSLPSAFLRLFRDIPFLVGLALTCMYLALVLSFPDRNEAEEKTGTNRSIGGATFGRLAESSRNAERSDSFPR